MVCYTTLQCHPVQRLRNGEAGQGASIEFCEFASKIYIEKYFPKSVLPGNGSRYTPPFRRSTRTDTCIPLKSLFTIDFNVNYL